MCELLSNLPWTHCAPKQEEMLMQQNKLYAVWVRAAVLCCPMCSVDTRRTQSSRDASCDERCLIHIAPNVTEMLHAMRSTSGNEKNFMQNGYKPLSYASLTHSALRAPWTRTHPKMQRCFRQRENLHAMLFRASALLTLDT